MRLKILTLSVLVLNLAAAAYSQDPTGASSKPDALAVLTAALKDDKLAPTTLLSLRAACTSGTDDKDLLVLFEALSRCGDKRLRLLATTTLAEIGGKDACPALVERLNNDPAMVVRSEALIHLLALGAVSDDQLRAALKLDDESIQCIAAKTLLLRHQPKEAKEVLQRLSQSKDLATACLSRLSLLTSGDASPRRALLEMAKDRKTPEDVLDLMLQQIAEEKTVWAKDMVEAVLRTEVSPMLKLRAYRTLAAVAPDVTAALVEAIETSDDLVVRVHLMRTLAQQKGCVTALLKMAKADEKDIACVLARLELARAGRDADKMSETLKEAFAMGHPVVVDYVLSDAREDLDGRVEPPARSSAVQTQPATRTERAPVNILRTYVAPLLEFIDSAPTDPEEMLPIHRRTAAAVTWLADSDLKEATDGLEKVMSGKYSAILRAAAVGLGKSKNRQCALRLSRPLLQSPYRDMMEDGALNLGRWGDKDASAVLDKIVANPADMPVLRAMACWYSLRIQGRTKDAAKELAKVVK
jgi:HEAT repeat protein